MKSEEFGPKPEWFQLADEDGFAPRSPAKRMTRILALASPLLVLGAGVVVSQAASTQPHDMTKNTVLSSASTPAASQVPANAKMSAQQSDQLGLTVGGLAITKPTGVVEGVGEDSTTGIVDSDGDGDGDGDGED